MGHSIKMKKGKVKKIIYLGPTEQVSYTIFPINAFLLNADKLTMTDFEVLQFISLKMFYAVLCGAIIGVERRLNHSPAGIKTQVLVCVGAMLFAVFPTIAGPAMQNETPRVIGQIVTGVGFLGAGTIIHNTRNVSGLTTAAWIWFTAAIGVFVGIGHGAIALFTTVTLTGVISLFRVIEKKYFGPFYASQQPKVDEAKEKDAEIRQAS
jgi:putative Mg2+ transporter-C (MgtC) family protein